MVSGGLLTLDQAAERLAVSPRTLRRWISSGLIPAFRQGRVLRLRALDLDRFIAERVSAAAPAASAGPWGWPPLGPGQDDSRPSGRPNLKEKA
jgi:excisionase family DNA binding protein